MDRALRAALWSKFSAQRMMLLMGLVKPEPLQALARILEQPGVTPSVYRIDTLEETADAMRALVSGQVHGKVVLRVSR